MRARVRVRASTRPRSGRAARTRPPSCNMRCTVRATMECPMRRTMEWCLRTHDCRPRQLVPAEEAPEVWGAHLVRVRVRDQSQG
eukprot:scaffold39936_cov18-Phaeocystis_antarctica.AAC.1